MWWLGVLLSGIVETMTNIAVLGGGQIGEALVSGLVASDYDPKSITVTNRSAEKSSYFEENYGVHTTSDNAAAIKDADYAFLCVKPYHIIDLLEDVSETLQSREGKIRGRIHGRRFDLRGYGKSGWQRGASGSCDAKHPDAGR